MKGIVLKKRLKRLLALVLAGMLALPALPVLADGEKAAGKTYDAWKLKAGDILQPGDKITLKEDQAGVPIMFMDYNKSAYLYSLSEGTVFSYSAYTIPDYDPVALGLIDPDEPVVGDVMPANPLKLSSDEFGGWKVTDADYYNRSCASQFHVYLEAMPQNTISSVSCKTEVSVQKVNDDDPTDPPEGAGVELYGVNTKTGATYKLKDGVLTAAPGDVVYACTKPVPGYLSKIKILDEEGPIEYDFYGEMNYGYAPKELAHWDSFYSEMVYYSSATEERYEFLPKDADAITAFPVPYEDVTVSAVYEKSSQRYSVSYAMYSDSDEPGSQPTTEPTTVPVNTKITIMKSTEGADDLWWYNNASYSGEYYQPGETIRVRGNYEFINLLENKNASPIRNSSMMSTFHYNERGVYSDKHPKATTVGNWDLILVKADLDQIPAGKTLDSYLVTHGEGEHESKANLPFQFGATIDATGFDGTSVISNGDRVSEVLFDKTPENLLVDLSEVKQVEWDHPEEIDTSLHPEKAKDYWKKTRNIKVWNSFALKNKAYDRTDAMEYYDLMALEYWGGSLEELYNYSDFFSRLRLLDLNKDGVYDVSVRLHINIYGLSGESNEETHESYRDEHNVMTRALTWKRLDGADACEKDSYDINLSRQGFGTLTIKLRGQKKDPQVEPKPGKTEVPDVNPNPSNALKELEEKITSTKNEKDIEGALFHLLQVKAVPKSEKAMKVTWKKVSGATQYIIYGAKCGKKDNFRRITTTTKTSYTQKKLKKGNFYKFIIVAVNGETPITIGKTVHAVTKGTKLGNNTEIKLSKKKVKLKVGGSKKIKATAMADEGKKVRHHRNLSWESDNEKIATVDSKGKIKAVSPGVCFVYAYAQNGVASAVKVTVR